ncbi:MAG: hypothetical protein LUD02_13815 [Tannerellaceae bacterium]|nr:hypothetical protein [Tannerellaceae bacterium]
MAVREILDYEEMNVHTHRRRFFERELNILQRDKDANELNIIRLEKQLFDLETEHRIIRERNKKQLELAYEDAVNSLISWESKYLLKSNATGTIVMGALWVQRNNVNVGDTICSVISGEKGMSIGKMQLAQNWVAGLETGNQVNIQLNEFPASTHGYLIGKVAAISYVPASKSYAIEVELPDKLITTSGKEIDYDVSLTGNAEIIVSSKTLLARIFGPIYNLLNDYPHNVR